MKYAGHRPRPQVYLALCLLLGCCFASHSCSLILDTESGGPTSCDSQVCAASNMVCGKNFTCVIPTSPDCQTVDGVTNHPNVIIIGSILNLEAEKHLAQHTAIELAIKEFNDSGALGEWKLARIGCNDQGNRDIGQAAATHLVNTIGVPAIVGPGFSSVYIDVANNVTIPAGVLTMSGSATSAAITGLVDNNLAWRTVASDAFQSVAMAQWLRDYQTQQGGTLRVLAFGKDDAYGTGLLNGLSAEIITDTNIEFVGITHWDKGDDPSADMNIPVSAGLTQMPDPDVVVLLGTVEVAEIIQIIEASPGTWTHRYLSSDGGIVIQTLQQISTTPSLLTRINATSANTQNHPLYDGFVQRFESRNPSIEARTYSENAYDAVYLIGYSIIRLLANNLVINGTGIAYSMPFMVTGMVINAGPTGPSTINDGANELRNGRSINYEGASGKLDFDLSTGEAGSNVDLFEVTGTDPNFEWTVIGQFDVGTGQWN